MEQLIILLDGSCKMEVRKMLISGKDAVSRVQEQDSLLYELGITTANSIQDFRIFEKSGREMRARGDSEKTKAAASHLVTLFINDCGVKKVAKGNDNSSIGKEEQMAKGGDKTGDGKENFRDSSGTAGDGIGVECPPRNITITDGDDADSVLSISFSSTSCSCSVLLSSFIVVVEHKSSSLHSK